MSKGYKKCFIDTETTGCDREKNHIFQISGSIIDTDDSVLEEFDFRFRPFSLENCEDSAFEKNGMTREKLANLTMSATEAYEKLIAVFGRHCNKFDKNDKMQFVAYNAVFDCDFIRKFFELNSDKYFGSWFWNPPICVMQCAAMFAIDYRGSFPNFKLETLCKAAELGWDEEKAHDSSYDIQQTIRLYQYLK